MWKRKFFFKNYQILNTKQTNKKFFFVCLPVLIAQIVFKTLEKKVRKSPPKSYHYFWAVVVAGGGMESGYSYNVVRDLWTCGKILYLSN